MKGIIALFLGLTSLFAGVFPNPKNITPTPINTQSAIPTTYITQSAMQGSTIHTLPTPLTDAQLLALASNKYADGNLPLGDNKYVTSAPKKGYIYLCHVFTDTGGAQAAGSWIQNNSWNILHKLSVKGNVSWPAAKFSNTISGNNRILVGNDLPLNHTTGTFPIQSSDPAYTYDRNPNAITSQSLNDTVSAAPTYSDTPYCMGGEVGVMTSGVALFDGFDAGLRDAAAREVQDLCNGHPQNKGEYQYHSLSNCFKDISEKTILGYALDGFPITGPQMAKDKYLTTEDLDECHGITSEIIMNGKKIITYHYVMTKDFPYSASCFRSKPIQPSGMSARSPQSTSNQQSNNMQLNNIKQTTAITGQGKQPPQEALTACSGKSQGNNCSFTSPRGDMITGICQTPPNNSLACIPNR